MRLNKKIMLSALSVVLLMAMAVTAITFSLADETDQGGATGDQVADAGDEVPVALTNIDYIIKNSNDESGDVDPFYRIVEIGSGDASPSLQAMVEDGSFKDFVIDGNRTIEATMKSNDQVVYNYFKAADVDDTDADTLAIISQADFIYVSQDPNAKYSSDNDIKEEVYNILHTYAVGDYKPFVIDSPTATGVVIEDDDILTMSQVASDYFIPSGVYNYTYKWDPAWTLDYYLSGTIGTDSMYIAINGKERSAYWETVIAGETTAKMAKFLVISASGSVMNTSGSMGNRMFSTDEALTAVANIYTDAEGNAIDNVYYCDGLLETKAYNMRYAVPDAIKVEETSVAALETADIDFADYDMVIIEDDCSAEVISEDLYSKFVAAMYGNVHITYGSGLASTSTSTGGSTGPTGSYNETNYAEIFYMVATDKEVERYQNIMVTNPTEFGIIATSKSAETCKTIADLINSSSYRGIGGPGSTSTMFTVLEIQPCYPIDTALAEKQKGYYTKPSDVLTGVSVDEIPEDTEYYAWELSKAKIADALGMDAGAINLVQMSTEEFATSKVDVLGTYDLVYIGGNTTAFKELGKYASVVNTAGWDQYLDGQIAPDLWNKLPIYTMYAHAGDFAKIELGMTGSSGGPVKGGIPMAKVVYDTSGEWGSNTFGTLNGNDITYNGYLRLKAYIDAGMPLIVSDEVSAAVDIIRTQREASEGGEYLQNSIDPDCNVFKFLDYCKGLEKQTNICWNFDHDGVEVVKAESEHGTTLNGQVHVFTDTVANEINTVYQNSTTRPKLAVTSMPATYNLYDETTKLEEKSLKYKFDVTGVSDDYTVNLYIDDDGNGLFETSTGELLATDNNVNELSFTVSDNFSGPLYWKLEVVDNTTKSIVSTTSISYIKASDQSKKQVSVLQIVPGDEPASHTQYALGEGANSGYNSLYFCTICQQAYKQLTYNPAHNAGDRLSNNALYSCNNNDVSHDANGYRYGYYFGLHEHVFGIVKYDSNLPQTDGGGNPTTTLGRDDWDQNLADEVSDLYDFDLTIMYRGEFEEISQTIADAYAGLTEEADIAAKKAEYKASADSYGSLYSEYELLAAEKEEDLREVLTTLVSESTGKKQSELQRLLDEKVYWDYYNIGNNDAVYNKSYGVTVAGDDFNDFYLEYVKANDLKIQNKELYDYYMYLYYGSEWLYEAFSTIIIGPAEDFGGDDITNTNALADLAYYIEKNGQVLLFHDTLTRFSTSGSSMLTKTLRGYFGMDRYRMVLDDKKTGATSDCYYLNYTLDPNIEASEENAKQKYFMMNLSYKPLDDDTRFASWLKDMQAVFGATPQKYYTNVQYTDGLLISTSTNKDYIMPYKYATFQWNTSAKWNNDAGSTEVVGTNKATQNNKGIITLYPFTLSDQLNISGTHCQAYALDLESEDMTVWYSLAGGTSTDKTMSSIYAATPNDGMDGYFIYSYGNINYCGAGHAKVTGKGKDNNDERRLYINIICNSVRPSVKQPTIEVFDHGTKDKNEIIERDIAAGKGYIYEVDGEKIYDDPESTLAGKLQGEQGYPEFTFKVTVDSEATLEYVNIYYDLDFDETAEIPDNTFTANKDVMIAQWGKDTNKPVSAGVYTDVTMWDATLNRLATTSEDTYDYFLDESDNYVSFAPTALKLDPAKDGSYFAPYGGKYTYIVIEAIDSNGNKVYQRIKIQIKEHLFNLT